MTERCGTCESYIPDPPPRGPGPNTTMPGFGKCTHLEGDSDRVSEWPWGCRFTPSRYEGPDKDAAAPQDEPNSGSASNSKPEPLQSSIPAPAAAKDDRPPLELT